MNQQMMNQLIRQIPPHAVVKEIAIYHHWVVAQTVDWGCSCFIPGAASLGLPTDAGRESDMNRWIGCSAAATAEALLSKNNALCRSVGIAILNSAIPRPQNMVKGSAESFFEAVYFEKKSCFIGHFRDAEILREKGAPVTIVELCPQPGDVHWNDAGTVLAECDMVFITGLTLINDSFEEVIARTPNATERILFGPTVPVSPLWFDCGITAVGSSLITGPAALMTYFQRGGTSASRAPDGSIIKVNLRSPNAPELNTFNKESELCYVD
jgi:uncharacterized protein (DUF4213/DUF364 family)